MAFVKSYSASSMSSSSWLKGYLWWGGNLLAPYHDQSKIYGNNVSKIYRRARQQSAPWSSPLTRGRLGNHSCQHQIPWLSAIPPLSCEDKLAGRESSKYHQPAPGLIVRYLPSIRLALFEKQWLCRFFDSSCLFCLKLGRWCWLDFLH